MSGWIRNVVWLCLAACAGVAHALDPMRNFHDYGIDNWSTSQGLPQTSVLTITQDRDGYIWMGTQDGLARFDGLRFDVYNRVNSDGTDPLNVQASLADNDGRVWFGTPKDVVVRTNGHFHNVPGGATGKGALALAQARDGTIWAATPNGALRYDGTTFVPSAMTAAAYALAVDGDSLWVGGIGKIVRIDASGQRAFAVPGAAGTPVTRLALTPSGLWIGTSAGLFLLPRDADAIRAQPLGAAPDGARIEHLFADHDGNLWIGTPTTLFRQRPDAARTGGTLERVRDEDLAGTAFIVSAFEDREGSLWLGSRTEGAFRLWNGWAARVGASEGFIDSLIWSVTRDPAGRMVFGSNSNVMRMDADGLHEIASAREIPNLSAYELSYDAAGRLWIGMRGGLAVIDAGNVVTPAAFAPLAHVQVNAIVPRGNTYWIGTHEGLFRYENGVLRRIPFATGVAEAPVRGVNVADDGAVVVATEAGVRQVENDELRVPAWARELEGLSAMSIATVRPGLLGIGTRAAGIVLASGGHVLVLDQRNGLPSNNSWAMQVLDGFLYVPNIDGVWRIPLDALPDPATAPRDTRIAPERVLGRLTGMQHIHCCNGGGRARVVADGDTLWFPAIHGAVRVDTRAIQPLPQMPTVVIEQVRHGAHIYRPGEELRLDGQPRDIEVQFTALSFREPRGILFRYRLEGYDTEWHDVGTRRAAFYTNLPPGRFRFRVEARTSDATAEYSPGANPQLSALDFELVPRWFERRNVQMCAFVVLVLMIAAAPLLIRARYRRRGRRLEALVQKRTHELHEANEQQQCANLALQHRNAELVALNDKLEHAQSQLIQSEKLASIGQLAAGVAHEINNPIGYVGSNLSTLQQYATQLLSAVDVFSAASTTATTARIRRDFDIDLLASDLPQLLLESQEGLEHVAKIVRDLKDFSRIDRTENWLRADLHRGLESALNMVGNELKFKAKIVKNFEQLPPVECLPSELNQVFVNILMNAGQAIRDKGTITIGTGRGAQHVWVEIADDGDGIPAEIVPRIFDPFFTTKPVGSGTGLGLSISYGIVLKHHGTIHVESTSGRGTTMRIELPIDQPKVQGDVASAGVPDKNLCET
jgi:signal transduction histidine kinase/ligand-binding sensor domain-containing protein